MLVLKWKDRKEIFVLSIIYFFLVFRLVFRVRDIEDSGDEEGDDVIVIRRVKERG